MRTIDVRQAKAQLSHLLEDVSAGEEIIISKAGRPLAKLVPLASPRAKRRLGALAGKVGIADDFDAPLPSDVIATFEA